MLLLAVWVFFGFFLLFASKAKAVLYISNCSVLDQPVEYVLTADITNATSSPCMVIATDNVTLNCANHKIQTYLPYYSVGVYAKFKFYITVKNCVIIGFVNGIKLEEPAGSLSYLDMLNNTLINNSWGIDLVNTIIGRVMNSTFKNNSAGIYFEISNSNYSIEGNLFENNTYGIYYDGLVKSKIINNSFIKNGNAIYHFSGCNNTIALNFFNSSSNFYTRELNSPNYFNTTAGNYWGYPNGTGFSDICGDEDQNGICDDKYIIYPLGIDYLPLSRYTKYSFPGVPAPGVSPPPTCGNGVCEPGENYFNCPQDCPVAMPPKACKVCDYSALNPKDPVQYAWVGACLLMNLIFCEPIIFALAFIFILFLFLLKEIKKRQA